MYSIETICRVIGGTFLLRRDNDRIKHLAYDSRRIQEPSASVFFALQTVHGDGHLFLQDAYRKGVRNFIVSQKIPADKFPESNLIQVGNTLEALQALATFHRGHFSIPVIGITGSNGKTIVKEWLFKLLQEDYRIVRSPRSFNSQVGVPLSVWQMNEQHTLAIFEAGISKPGEMEKLAAIIRPTIGIFTNLGEAHSQGFESQAEKAMEKSILFSTSDVVIYGQDNEIVSNTLNKIKTGLPTGSKPFSFGWGTANEAHFRLTGIYYATDSTRIEGRMNQGNQMISFVIPFTDRASVENAITCCCVLLALGMNTEQIRKRMARLHPIEMRLQLNHSFNDCLVVNDSYSTDVTSLRIALDFMKQQGSGLKRTVILSEFLESGRSEEELYRDIAYLLKEYDVKKAVVIGEKISMSIVHYLSQDILLQPFLSTDDFIKDFRSSSFFNEIILIKGARRFTFERIAKLFERKLHETVLEINLNALAHNLKEYQKQLKPGTRTMAMVKAFSYGSGGAEIASVLQYHNTDYLGVAYADEGADLVKAGISLPIMVMNAEPSSFQSIVDHNLQPVIFSFDLLKQFENYLIGQGLKDYPIHLEIETGMNRLGFVPDDCAELAKQISQGNSFRIQSVFTHLAASEDPAEDTFTLQQHNRFLEAIAQISFIPYAFLKHISNSAAIIRHPGLQMDMVRLGIGLYGIEIDNEDRLDLQPVATLRSTIAQLKKIKKGESVSYNRRGVVQRDSVIATVRIGYADGYSRQFSKGKGKMLVHGKRAPVIGTVCMDMTMIDVTDIPGTGEGDEVVVFGPGLPTQELAEWINTIPYEIMTSISQRVKRVYFHE